jgi:aerobic carbon-monoxide dehydrogenase large subunit
MPYTNPMGQTYDSGKFESVLDQGLALADWAGFDARRPSRRRAAGCAAAASPPSSNGPAATPSRSAWRSTCCRRHHRALQRHPGHGPGHRHQLRAAGGGRVRRADREASASAGRHRPRQRLRQRRQPLALHRRLGRAVASERTVEKARDLAAEALEARPRTSSTAPACFRVVGTDLADRPVRPAAASRATHQVDGDVQAPAAPSWPNACHICEVEIDPDTGVVEVVAYASVNDIGRVVSPTIVHRPGRRRRGAGHRPGAVRAGGLRPVTSGQLLDGHASWTTRCRAPTDGSAASRPRSTPPTPRA